MAEKFFGLKIDVKDSSWKMDGTNWVVGEKIVNRKIEIKNTNKKMDKIFGFSVIKLWIGKWVKKWYLIEKIFCQKWV